MSKIININFLKFDIFFLVCLGAILGSLLRWQINNNFWANILSSAFLGFICGFNFRSKQHVFLVVGFCGSLSTFSGWISDVITLFRDSLVYEAAFLLFSTLIVGFLALSLGFLSGKKIRQFFLPL